MGLLKHPIVDCDIEEAGLALLAFASLMRHMHTMTPTKARANLSALLQQAINGEEIGIVCNGRIVALRPVEVTAADYARMEYGIAEDEISTIASALHAKAKKAIQSGKARTFNGNIEDAIRG